jgi:hypothetical protein
MITFGIFALDFFSSRQLMIDETLYTLTNVALPVNTPDFVMFPEGIRRERAEPSEESFKHKILRKIRTNSTYKTLMTTTYFLDIQIGSLILSPEKKSWI